MKKYFVLFTTFFLVAASLVGGIIGGKVNASDQTNLEKDQLFKHFAKLLNTIETNAAEPPESSDLVYGSIRQMLQRLDPHSSFFTPKEFQLMEEENTGRYFGLGIRIRALTRGSGRIVIIEPPYPGSPAAHVGLQVGDVIFKVNGESVDDWDQDDVVSKLKGPKGTKVHITVQRPGEPLPLELDVLRDEIPRPTIVFYYRIRPDIGYVRIDRFAENTHDELLEAFTSLNLPSLEGLILDLRDNPGGYLNQAIKISEEFLPKGAPIVAVRNRDGRDEQKYSVRSGGNIKTPLVILINNDSASASEIVSGAVQDNDRGLILGERSFGKGLVQTVYHLSDRSGLALTTGRYFTPSGRCLQRAYNGSIYDYYNPRRRKEDPPANGDIKYTLSGRKVYGEGGIQPDQVLKNRELKRLELTLAYKDVFFKFANQAMQEGVPSLPGLSAKVKNANPEVEITAAVLKDFQDFLGNLKITFTPEEFEQCQEFIRRGIKAEIATRFRGILEGYKIRAEGDDQILKAIEIMPQARQMLVKTKEILANLQTRRDKSRN